MKRPKTALDYFLITIIVIIAVLGLAALAFWAFIMLAWSDFGSNK